MGGEKGKPATQGMDEGTRKGFIKKEERPMKRKRKPIANNLRFEELLEILQKEGKEGKIKGG